MSLLTRAQQIKDETIDELNTAERVGGLLEDMVKQFDTAYNNYFDFSGGEVTAIAQVNTWYKLNTTTNEGFSRDGLVHSNNRITWTGVTTQVFKVQGIVSLESGNGNQVHVALFKNGTLWPCSEQFTTTSGTGKANNIAFQCYVQLATNDFIEVWVKNATGTTAITLDNINVTCEQL